MVRSKILVLVLCSFFLISSVSGGPREQFIATTCATLAAISDKAGCFGGEFEALDLSIPANVDMIENDISSALAVTAMSKWLNAIVSSGVSREDRGFAMLQAFTSEAEIFFAASSSTTPSRRLLWVDVEIPVFQGFEPAQVRQAALTSHLAFAGGLCTRSCSRLFCTFCASRRMSTSSWLTALPQRISCRQVNSRIYKALLLKDFSFMSSTIPIGAEFQSYVVAHPSRRCQKFRGALSVS